MPDDRLTEEERGLLLRLLTRAINYKSNGDTVRIAVPLLAKLSGVDKVVVVSNAHASDTEGLRVMQAGYDYCLNVIRSLVDDYGEGAQPVLRGLLEQLQEYGPNAT